MLSEVDLDLQANSIIARGPNPGSDLWSEPGLRPSAAEQKGSGQSLSIMQGFAKGICRIKVEHDLYSRGGLV